MDRAPSRFRQRALAAALITLCSAQAGGSAAAQDIAAPAQPTPASAPSALAAPETGSPPAATPAPAAAPPPASGAPLAPDSADQVRQHELDRLYAQLTRQRATHHSGLVPLIGLGLGLATAVAGGTLLVDSLSDVGDLPCEEDNQPCGSNDRKGYAGATLLAIGLPMILVSIPMLIVRGRREARIRATETAIRQLGGQLSLAPTLGPRGDAGLRVHARF
jgi:hypothetical protein